MVDSPASNGPAFDEEASRNIVAYAREAGVNFIDTADAYAAGKSEQIVGRAVKAERDQSASRVSSSNPANCPIRSSSAGQT